VIDAPRLSTADGLARAWILPLLYFQIYLGASVALFFLGPWPWPVRQAGELLAYLLAAQVAMAIGYLGAGRGCSALPLTVPTPRSGTALTVLAAAVSLLMLVPTSLARTGSPLPDVIEGFTNAGAAYNAHQGWLEISQSYFLVEYARILLAPMLVALLPWTIVYGGRLSIGMRFVAASGVIGFASIYVATGTNKGLADMLITVPWLIVLAVLRGEFRVRVPRWLVFVLMIAAAFTFLDFFGRGQLQRAGGVGEFGVFNSGSEIIGADREHPLSRNLPVQGVVVFESLSRYLGQGYFALEQSFGLESARTLGAGSSIFIARNVDRIFDTRYFSDESLPGQLERQTGWGAQALWHSIYPWLASDFGFAGTLVVMGAFGWLLGAVWLDALRTLRPTAVALLHMLLIVFHYIPANNQAMQSGESAAAFFMLLAWWGASRWILPDARRRQESSPGGS